MNDSNYIKLYNKTYKKSIIEGENYIKNLIISRKKEHKNVNNALNGILANLNKYISQLYINEKSFASIIQLYKTKSRFYEPEFTQLIIPNEIADAFKDIKEKKDGYNFKELICGLAEYMAYNDLNINFSNSNSLYQLMYRLNDFTRFDLSLIEGTIEYTELYEKLRLKVFLPAENDNLYEETESKKCKKKPNFCLNRIYSKNINELYFYLVKQKLVSSVETSKKDFYNTLHDDWNPSQNKIYVKDNGLLSCLIQEIDFAFGNFKDSTIGKSEMFYSKKGKPISATNIYSSRRRIKRIEYFEKSSRKTKQIKAIEIAKKANFILKQNVSVPNL